MKNFKVNKKKLMTFALTCLISGTLTKSHTQEFISVITTDSKSYGKYSNGNVYIGSLEYLNSLNNLDKDNDVLVEDLRASEDPNMKIINSYAVDDSHQMMEIIHLLKLYESMNPSEWNRTENSMYLEWLAHNMMYSINYKIESTTDVDFNNADEKKYRISR